MFAGGAKHFFMSSRRCNDETRMLSGHRRRHAELLSTHHAIFYFLSLLMPGVAFNIFLKFKLIRDIFLFNNIG